MLPLTWMGDELYLSAPHVLDLSAAARLLTLGRLSIKLHNGHRIDLQSHKNVSQAVSSDFKGKPMTLGISFLLMFPWRSAG